MKNNLSVSTAWDSGIIDSDLSPFSDRLMMESVRASNVELIGTLGKAVSVVALRHDLGVNTTKEHNSQTLIGGGTQPPFLIYGGAKLNTLIAYATKHGCTESIAVLLSEKLNGKVDLCNLKVKRSVDLSQYHNIIIGGSIHMGKIQKEVNEFCTKNINVLINKKIGLFICGMLFEKAETELHDSFSQELLSKAIAKDFFGGQFIFKKMNPLDRLIVNKVVKIGKDTINISEEKINKFAHLMNNV